MTDTHTEPELQDTGDHPGTYGGNPRFELAWNGSDANRADRKTDFILKVKRASGVVR